MVVPFQTYWGCMTYVAYDLYAVTSFAYSETFAIQDFLIAKGMEFGETCTELKFVSVNADSSVSPLFFVNSVLWQTVGVYA